MTRAVLKTKFPVERTGKMEAQQKCFVKIHDMLLIVALLYLFQFLILLCIKLYKLTYYIFLRISGKPKLLAVMILSPSEKCYIFLT